MLHCGSTRTRTAAGATTRNANSCISPSICCWNCIRTCSRTSRSWKAGAGGNPCSGLSTGGPPVPRIRTDGLEVIERGAVAGSLLAALRPYLQARQNTALAQLVQGHYDGTLTEPIMRSGIAAIAELRSLERDLEAQVAKGRSADAGAMTP